MGVKIGKKWAWSSFLAMTLFCLNICSCSSIPQPCDPEFLASQQMIMGATCRAKAENTCPGYSELSEDKKLECPGVMECLEKIEKAEADCNGK